MTQREKVASLENQLAKDYALLEEYAAATWSDVARQRFLTQQEVVKQRSNQLSDERGILIRESLAA